MTQHSTPEGDALRVLVDEWFVQARFGHWDSCPAHPARVRGSGPCDPEKCGYDRKYEEFIAALAARGAPVEDETRRLREALMKCVEAFMLTREYVGEDLLPPIEGWAWFDAVCLAAEVLADTALGLTPSSEPQEAD